MLLRMAFDCFCVAFGPSEDLFLMVFEGFLHFVLKCLD